MSTAVSCLKASLIVVSLISPIKAWNWNSLLFYSHGAEDFFFFCHATAVLDLHALSVYVLYLLSQSHTALCLDCSCFLKNPLRLAQNMDATFRLSEVRYHSSNIWRRIKYATATTRPRRWSKIFFCVHGLVISLVYTVVCLHCTSRKICVHVHDGVGNTIYLLTTFAALDQPMIWVKFSILCSVIL